MLRTLAAFVVTTLLSLAGWYWLGQPVAIAEPAVEDSVSCLSYTPFRNNESPFDAGLEFNPVHIEEDLTLLARHTACIRIYAAGGMELVPPIAQKIGMKILLGAWVSRDTTATRHEIERVVKLANAYPETIRGVLVGNEALLRREIEPDRLADLIREVKQRVVQPVSYADVWEFHLRHPQVAEASDFVTIHILPYWEDEPVIIDEAIGHVRRIRQQVVDRFPGKQVMIGESGWPSVGRMRKGALPSPVNEARFIRGFVAAAHAEGWDYNLIEAFDQPWKRLQEGAVGGYWGIFDTARQDKSLLSGSVSNHPYWMPLALISVAMGMLIILVWRIPPVLSPLAAAIALGWTLQLEQLWMITRSGLEAGAVLLLLVTLFAASVAALARTADRPFVPRLEARLALLLGSMAAIISLWLVFDPRYRDFFIAGFLPPAVLMLLSSRGVPVLRQGDEEIAVGALLVPTAIAIAIGETVLNHQALIWSLTSLLLGSTLIRRGMRAKQIAKSNRA